MITNLLIGLMNGSKPSQPIVSGDVFYRDGNAYFSRDAHSMEYGNLVKLFEEQETPLLADVVASVVSDSESKFNRQYDLMLTRRGKK